MQVLMNAVPLPALLALAGVTRRKLYLDAKCGRIPGIERVGSRYYVPADAARAYAERVSAKRGG